MKVTRVIAFCVIAASVGISALHAQSLRDGTTPAEFPPKSFKGKQYVDSKGCIFIRAGIDGNVTWVPRVSRKRKQICGYKPTLSASQVASAPKVKPTGPAPVQITLAPAAAVPAKPAPVAAPVVTAKPKPKPVPVAVASAPAKPAPRAPRAAPKPLVFVNPPPKPAVAATTPTKPASTTVRTVQRSTPRPAPQPLVFVNPAPERAAPQTTVRATARRGSAPSPGPIPPAGTVKSHGTCANASDFSQQFINSNARYPVRCGPQNEPPVQARGAAGRSSAVDSNTRIVPRHVYEQRQNTTNVQVAAGYQSVWDDDRLNPHRAERTSAPITLLLPAKAPSGYRAAWDDDRLNDSRVGGLTATVGSAAAGDAQTDQIWTRKVPRTLIVAPLPKSKQTIVLSSRSSAQTVSRTSTRSAVQSVGKPKYVRVATYASDASARSTAQNLARTGLPMRLGTVTRKGKAYRVVLAGPFTSSEQAKAALATVRRAGFSKAKISK